MLSVADEKLRDRLAAFAADLEQLVLDKDAALACWASTLPMTLTTANIGVEFPVQEVSAVYELSEEHEALREAVRALAEKEIAPYAAEVDEQERYPSEAQDALVKAGFNAVHIPEEYDGQGADAVAACIVIEEVARVDASASLIPAVNKLGTQPIILSGVGRAEEAGAANTRVRRGIGVVRTVGARSGLGHGVDALPSCARRRQVDPERHEVLDHQRGRVDVVHGHGRNGPERGEEGQRHLGLRGPQGRPGLLGGPEGTQAGHQGQPDLRNLLRELRDPGGPDHRRPRARA